MKRKLLLLSLIPFFGCCKISKKTFVLSDGKSVVCSFSWREECGMTLENCEDGYKYKCQNNVKEGAK